MTMTCTADLCDREGQGARVCVAPWRAFGGRPGAMGQVATVRVRADAGLALQCLREPGHGRILAIDAGADPQAAVLGDRMARLGAANGWAGILVNGAVRDVAVLATLDIAIVALGSVPARGSLDGTGERDVPVTIQGVRVHPGDLLAMDGDGVVVLPAQPGPS